MRVSAFVWYLCVCLLGILCSFFFVVAYEDSYKLALQTLSFPIVVLLVTCLRAKVIEEETPVAVAKKVTTIRASCKCGWKGVKAFDEPTMGTLRALESAHADESPCCRRHLYVSAD